MSFARRALVLAVLAAVAAAPVGCRKRAREEASGTDPRVGTLPTLELRDDARDLLLTWVDAKGDAHTVVSIADVPLEGRDQVRVVVTTRQEGTGDLFWVANLTTKNPDGAYPVTTRTRAEWDAMIAERRKARLAAAPAATPEPPAGSAEPAPVPAGTQVVVYGAEWCEACHAAMAWLKRRGVPAIEKDIEEDPHAAREMQAKLARAGLRGGSIPVIDVRGRIFVGFEPHAIEAALAAGGTRL